MTTEKIAALEAENARLRTALADCANNVGAVASPKCSLDFLEVVPQEVRLVTERLQRERDHWKANHESQVERARVLIERPDMPLERTKAYASMRTLQHLCQNQKMLLEAFTGQLQAPADQDPYIDPVPAFRHTMARLKAASDRQQPAPVPDQMALVWRIDVMRLIGQFEHRDAFFSHQTGNPTYDQAKAST